jgi:glycosyltransferase involved in cell wall biosynthesis
MQSARPRNLGHFARARGRIPFAVAGHVTEVAGPVQAFYRYLARSGVPFAFARHPFAYSSISRSELEVVASGEVTLRRSAAFPRGLALLRDIALNLIWFGRRFPSDVFVGIDNVNAACGIVLRALGRTRAVVYYVIDYTPRRFRNHFVNALYHALDRFAVAYADEIWNISERIAAVRSVQGVDSRRNRVVGVGVELSLIQASPPRKRPHDLVVISHLTESKGIQLAIRAMRRITQRIADARLLIVGTGPYEQQLRTLVDELQLQDCVVFCGLMQHRELFEFLPTCGIALAPYLDDPGSVTYFADPTKPKEYLAAGLPVVITRVPWIAELIDSTPMGIAVEYDEEQLVSAVERLCGDRRFYETCAANSLSYAATLNWEGIYAGAMSGGVVDRVRGPVAEAALGGNAS